MTVTCDVWIDQRAHELLMGHLFPGDRDEHGAVLRCGIVQNDKAIRLVVRKVDLAIDGEDYGPGQYGYRALSTNFIHRNIIACRNEKLAYLAVHNHGGDQYVAFSDVDMRSHELGYGALRDIGRGIPVGALVFAPRAVEADVWLPDGGRARLGEFRVIGSAIERLYSSPRAAAAAFAPEADRQLRMFGAAGQALLGKAKVAVVGLGGVGSLVSEYLARLGVGDLLLIDPDQIETSNLARVVGATRADVREQMFKVDIAARVAREAKPDIRIAAYKSDVTQCSIAALVTSCDFIILAADSMRAKLLANAVAHQFFVPVIQLGSKVRSDQDGHLVEAMSVVRQIRPGSGCLWCNELIDPGQLAIEAKSDEERIAQGYGTNEPNPSVITLNAVAAAHGVNDFLFDYLGLRRETATQFDHHHFLTGKHRRVVAKKVEDCRECGRRFGMGDAMSLPCSTRARAAPSSSIFERILAWVRRTLKR